MFRRAKELRLHRFVPSPRRPDLLSVLTLASLPLRFLRLLLQLTAAVFARAVCLLLVSLSLLPVTPAPLHGGLPAGRVALF